MYSIPLDGARQDAAPHHLVPAGGGGGSGSGGQSGGGGGTASGGGNDVTGNGGPKAGGAGSRTYGLASGSGAASRAGTHDTGTAPVLVPGGQPGSLVHSSNGFGSSSSVPGLNSQASAGLGAVQSDASSAPLLAILLSLVVIGIGVYAGTRARRPSRPESRQSSS